MAEIDLSLDAEEWRPIPGYEGFEASSYGRIRTLDRWVEYIQRGKRCRRFFKGGVRNPHPASGRDIPYLEFTIGRGRGRALTVHRAVCLAFHGPAPDDRPHAAHLDGRYLHNLPGNLAWVTPAENAAHKKLHGTQTRGEEINTARLTEAQIPYIFARYVWGQKPEELGLELGVTREAILAVLRRKSWAHVEVASELLHRVAALRSHRRRLGLAFRGKTAQSLLSGPVQFAA